MKLLSIIVIAYQKSNLIDLYGPKLIVAMKVTRRLRWMSHEATMNVPAELIVRSPTRRDQVPSLSTTAQRQSDPYASFAGDCGSHSNVLCLRFI